MHIHGGCHCGNIAFELTWPGEAADIPARACDCTFCTKHGGVWTSHPGASLRVSIDREDAISVYEFGTRTAQFHVCSKCGVVPVVTCRLDDKLYAVVNVNTFANVDAALLRRASASFEGEETGSRLARRARNWIADVRFVTSAEALRAER
jgi:hypothetical protein